MATRICLDGDLEGKAEAALKRIVQVANHNKEVKKSESAIAWGLLKFILSRVKEKDNWILGISTMEKPL